MQVLGLSVLSIALATCAALADASPSAQRGQALQVSLARKRPPSPSPSPSPTPPVVTLSPAPEPITNITVTSGATPTAAATPIPTNPPAPHPLTAPSQPTIPHSLEDPNVRSIIARPIPEMAQLAWMKGTWHVTGTANRTNGSTYVTPPTTYVFSPILKGRWMFGADGRDENYLYLAFDPFARQWIAVRFSADPSFGIWQSEGGWVGNRIDFVTNFSYVNGRQYRRRMTITHKDARTFAIHDQEEVPDGSWSSDAAYEFTKAE